MRLSPMQMQKLVEKVIENLKAQKVITFKEDERKVVERAVLAVKQDYQREAELEQEVNKMLERLERTNPGEFERHKMFQLMKQKLAKERKVVL
ncbi:MAG: hypothetical protein C5B49_02075 [Bdellovibrio sp.]|nr:MAG: hypothetical protein C5B49_02075 [Bdellovibrio sp.]